ncbi:MAG: divalent-cation tolerance protein CutA [Gemmatimonadales bacterium]
MSPTRGAGNPADPSRRGQSITQTIQVNTTCASREEADRIAGAAVGERLAACAQVHGPISSTFRWQGKIETSVEWYCHLKTTAARLPELETRIKSLHSYEVPEIIALPILGGSTAYLRWIEHQVSDEP